MNCNEASELLPAAVLGDLDRDRQRAVHAHLAGCDRCLEEENEFFRSMHLLRAHADEEPGEGFHAAVLARAAAAAAAGERAAPAVPFRRVGLLTQTLLTAAATALLVVGLQTVLESWSAVPAPVPPGSAVSGATMFDEERLPATRLLEGTLFDRRRNVPEALRRLRKQRQRGDAPRPLDL